MLLSLIVLLLVAAIAYFHFVQGFFSATLSAILTVVAAVFAFGYHEWIVRQLGGRIPDYSHAAVLVGLFAVVYLVLRTLFDKFVPGNLTVPLMVDRVGGGLMGAVAGMFSVGILLIAIQSLPFGPSILGYTRYATAAPASATGGTVNNLLQGDTLADTPTKRLLIPADDLVVNIASRLSGDGALGGNQNFRDVHPAYLDELFFQRLGIQAGAKHVAVIVDGGQTDVTLQGVYSPPLGPGLVLAQADAEVPSMPQRKPPSDPQFKPDPAQTLLMIRLVIAGPYDSDGKNRLGPTAVRLVSNGRNYFPIGTLDMTTAFQLRVNRPDDFLIVESSGTVDFVFQLPEDSKIVDDPKKPTKLSAGAFIEVKRMATIDLTGAPVKREMPPILKEKSPTVMRKTALVSSRLAVPIPKAPPPGAAPAVANAPAASNTPATPNAPAAPNRPAAANAPGDGSAFEYASKEESANLPAPVNVGANNGEGVVTFASGTATLKERRIMSLEVKPTVSKAALGQGDNQIRQLWVPMGMQLVQIIGTASTKEGADAWEWATKLGQFEMTDQHGEKYKPQGAWAQLKEGASAEDRISAAYDAETPKTDVPRSNGRPTDVRIFFLLPQAVTPKELQFEGKVLKAF